MTIVSAAAARQYWPGEDPVGKYVLWHAGSFLKSTSKHAEQKPAPIVRLSVIGVAGDVKAGGSAPPPMLYVPLQQHYQSEVIDPRARIPRSTARLRDRWSGRID